MKFGEIKIHGEVAGGGFGFAPPMKDEKVHEEKERLIHTSQVGSGRSDDRVLPVQLVTRC
jgi:hypothetical protein